MDEPAAHGRSRPVRVFIVDDSAVVRQLLTRLLSNDPGIEIAGTAPDPLIAWSKIERSPPDVITLDVEMPRMDGLTFLRKVMAERPLPVIILSSLAESGTEVALNALEAGAIDVLAKPKGGLADQASDHMARLIDAIKAAGRARVPRAPVPREHFSIPKPRPRPGTRTDKVIAIGGSTGGTEALKTVLSGLPANSPAVLAVLHMPAAFTHRYAERLNELCEIEVREARDGDALQPGLALVARGDHHLMLCRYGDHLGVQLNKGPLVCRQRPSVEVLFHSVARVAGPNAMGVILTGMGADGADGLLAMRTTGAHTVAQDESTCVVFGMPKEAIQRGAAARVLPIHRIAAECRQWSEQPAILGTSRATGASA